MFFFFFQIWDVYNQDVSVGELVHPSPLGHVGIGIFGFILPILFGLAISPGILSSLPFLGL